MNQLGFRPVQHLKMTSVLWKIFMQLAKIWLEMVVKRTSRPVANFGDQSLVEKQNKENFVKFFRNFRNRENIWWAWPWVSYSGRVCSSSSKLCKSHSHAITAWRLFQNSINEVAANLKIKFNHLASKENVYNNNKCGLK